MAKNNVNIFVYIYVFYGINYLMFSSRNEGGETIRGQAVQSLPPDGASKEYMLLRNLLSLEKIEEGQVNQTHRMDVFNEKSTLYLPIPA